MTELQFLDFELGLNIVMLTTKTAGEGYAREMAERGAKIENEQDPVPPPPPPPPAPPPEEFFDS